MIDALRDIQRLLLEDLAIETRRFLYDRIDLEPRLVGLVGPRGVGKTTLLLQLLKNRPELAHNSFYVSADHLYFTRTTLFDFVNELHLSAGVCRVFIDEIHKYPAWNRELKNIYDSFPRVQIVFSGSSSLDLSRGTYDLSRRAVVVHLPGLSFREYLNFQLGTNFEPLSLETIIGDHGAYGEVAAIPGLMGHFREYLAAGYYPFSLTEREYFFQRLQRVIDKTVYEDIANFYNLKTENLRYFKTMLYYLATIPPGEINTHNLAKNLGADDKTVQKYLHMLMETGLARGLMADRRGGALLRKPVKLYLGNPALQHAVCHELGKDVDTGALRELFFITMLSHGGHRPAYPADTGGDVTVRETVFEIGGRKKDRGQLRNVTADSFVVKDNILTGSPTTVPLYFFGFLY